MKKHTVKVECPIARSFRVEQVAGMFDVPLPEKAVLSFTVDIPDLSDEWEIGVIVGPSGSGKTTIAKSSFEKYFYRSTSWQKNVAVIDAFGEIPVKEITRTLTAVGFSSPPAWVKPYAVLSNGEQFRCNLARALLGSKSCVVYDEFTSVVDRTVAKVGSAAVSKAIRKKRLTQEKRFVAVTCHYDVVEWLEPDWVLDMGAPNKNGELGQLTRRLLRRPQLQLEVVRCESSAWELFKTHHYLSADHNRSAACFLAMIDNTPVAFSSWLPYVGKLSRHGKIKRAHRSVVLPDFQGIGIGHRLVSELASMWSGLGYMAIATAAHPSLIHARVSSPLWHMHRPPSRTQRDTRKLGATLAKTRANNRLTAGFKYVGPAMERQEAEKLLGN